jgi:hypothetical protein
VVEYHQHSVAAHPAVEDDDPVVGGLDRRAVRGGDIDPGVEFAGAKYRVDEPPVPRGDRAGDRPEECAVSQRQDRPAATTSRRLPDDLRDPRRLGFELSNRGFLRLELPPDAVEQPAVFRREPRGLPSSCEPPFCSSDSIS